jgi:hypothetical protein
VTCASCPRSCGGRSQGAELTVLLPCNHLVHRSVCVTHALLPFVAPRNRASPTHRIRRVGTEGERRVAKLQLQNGYPMVESSGASHPLHLPGATVGLVAPFRKVGKRSCAGRVRSGVWVFLLGFTQLCGARVHVSSAPWPAPSHRMGGMVLRRSTDTWALIGLPGLHTHNL